jgi:choline-sulfatase
VPLIFAGPGIVENAVCNQPAELLDLFPTLLELCGLPVRDDLEGRSLAPQLADPAAKRTAPAITTHNQGNHGIRSQRWRYIRYADGSEELYDMEKDPNEWTNLANDSSHAAIIAEHRRWLPRIDVAPVPGSAHRVLTYNRTTGEAVWEGKPIRPDDPWPME